MRLPLEGEGVEPDRAVRLKTNGSSSRRTEPVVGQAESLKGSGGHGSEDLHPITHELPMPWGEANNAFSIHRPAVSPSPDEWRLLRSMRLFGRP